VIIAGVLILRSRQPDTDRPYRAWGHPWSTYMSSRLATYRPVPGRCRNRYRRLRRDHGDDILAGVPGPCALRIKLNRVNTITVQIHVSEE
jgi:hypothetical protein